MFVCMSGDKERGKRGKRRTLRVRRRNDSDSEKQRGLHNHKKMCLSLLPVVFFSLAGKKKPPITDFIVK